MTIELPCICHVPPQLAKRLKLCVDTVAGYFRFSPGQDGYQAVKELKEFVESIQPKDQHTYPTPVEVAEMANAKPDGFECDWMNERGKWVPGLCSGFIYSEGKRQYWICDVEWFADQIRVLKPNA